MDMDNYVLTVDMAYRGSTSKMKFSKHILKCFFIKILFAQCIEKHFNEKPVKRQ